MPRNLTRATVSVLAGLIVAAIVTSAVPARAQGFDWKKYAGTELRFLSVSFGWGNDVVRPALSEFEQLTGIKVIWEAYPEDQFRQKLAVELVGGSAAVDGFASLPSYDGLRFAKAGWYEPLQKYVTNAALTNPQFNFDDFFPNMKNAASIDGALVGLPIGPEVQLLYYRKDVLDAHGVSVPQTLEELEAAARKLTDKPNNFYGFVTRGKRAAAVYTFAPFLFNFGGQWLDKANRPGLNSPEAVKAFDFYGRILRESGPPGAVNVGFYEVNDLMAQGRVAMATASNYTFSVLENPSTSKVAGKIGSARIPRGPAGSHSPVVSWVVSVAAQSRHKEAAWYFLQWATGKDMMMRAAQAKLPVSRRSVWESPAFQGAMAKDWLNAFVGTLGDAYANQTNPIVVAVPEVRDAIGGAIVAAIEGQDVKAAADKAQTAVTDIIKKTQ